MSAVLSNFDLKYFATHDGTTTHTQARSGTSTLGPFRLPNLQMPMGVLRYLHAPPPPITAKRTSWSNRRPRLGYSALRVLTDRYYQTHHLTAWLSYAVDKHRTMTSNHFNTSCNEKYVLLRFGAK